jgi:hypothetical protein
MTPDFGMNAGHNRLVAMGRFQCTFGIESRDEQKAHPGALFGHNPVYTVSAVVGASGGVKEKGLQKNPMKTTIM